jgi:hypothetical protein
MRVEKSQGGARAARCVVAQGAPVERGVADWEVVSLTPSAWPLQLGTADERDWESSSPKTRDQSEVAPAPGSYPLLERRTALP